MTTRQSGLSLIELMIAITLSSILLAGIIQVFVTNKRGFEITQDLSQTQESGRVAMQFLSNSVRHAGHWGSLDPDQVALGTFSVTAAGSCDKTWAIKVEGLVGYEGAAALPAAANCLKQAATYQPNSDIFVTRYSAGSGMTNSPAAGQLYLRSEPNTQGYLFEGSSYDDAKAAIPFTDMVYNYPYYAEQYFIRQCAEVDAAGACISGSPPALVRTALTASATGPVVREEVIAEGIEQMQVQYGIDSNGDSHADQYKKASDMSAANWRNVLVVRLALLTRSKQRDGNVDVSQDFAAELLDYSFTVAKTDATRPFKRQIIIKDINVRNTTRRS